MLCAVQDFPVVCVEGVHSVCFPPILFLFMHTKAKVDPCSDELNSIMFVSFSGCFMNLFLELLNLCLKKRKKEIHNRPHSLAV